MNQTNPSALYDGSTELARRCSGELSAPALQHVREGLEQLSLGEPAAAVVALNAALACAPNLPDVHVALGLAYAMTSRIYPAIDHLTCATELEPENFHAPFKLAQLYFKLRVPAKGYEWSRRALDRAVTFDERRLIAELLRQERERERDGIARPWFHKAFSRSALWLAASGTAAVLLALLLHIH